LTTIAPNASRSLIEPQRLLRSIYVGRLILAAAIYLARSLPGAMRIGSDADCLLMATV
jgi:hypothetical protein